MSANNNREGGGITPKALMDLARYDPINGRGKALPADIRDALRAAAYLITTQADKIEGLTCDLRMAVETAYGRGAVEWTRLNYPKWFAELEAAEAHQ